MVCVCVALDLLLFRSCSYVVEASCSFWWAAVQFLMLFLLLWMIMNFCGKEKKKPKPCLTLSFPKACEEVILINQYFHRAKTEFEQLECLQKQNKLLRVSMPQMLHILSETPHAKPSSRRPENNSTTAICLPTSTPSCAGKTAVPLRVHLQIWHKSSSSASTRSLRPQTGRATRSPCVWRVMWQSGLYGSDWMSQLGVSFPD